MRKITTIELLTSITIVDIICATISNDSSFLGLSALLWTGYGIYRLTTLNNNER